MVFHAHERQFLDDLAAARAQVLVELVLEELAYHRGPVFLFHHEHRIHVGVQITPITAAEKGVAVPELMMAAFVRGMQVDRDMCVVWIPQQDFARPVSELRATYNIQPRA